MCTPEHEPRDTCSNELNSSEQTNQKSERPRRQRLSTQEKFAIIQDLKARNCSIKVIATVYNTTTRNIWRWKALYASYDDILEFYLEP
jgi:transcriptional regulator with PAS, ATPase and Fis domain